MPGDTVIVHAGTYRETVNPRRSGLPGAPITFKAAKGEVVVLSGTEPISGWALEKGNIYHAPVPSDFYPSKNNYSDQIFVDGAMMNQARWPNTTLDLSMPVKATLSKFVSKTRDKATNWTTGVIECDTLKPATDGFYNGAEIFFQPNNGAWSWAFSGKIVDQKGKMITFITRNDCGKDGKQDVYDEKSRFYIFNKRELLDAPGEWYHDKKAGELFLWLPAGDSPAKHRIEARKRDFAFVLEGLSFITLQGFQLFACTVTTDLKAGNGREWDEKGNDLYPWPTGDYIPASHDILLDSLNVKYPSHFTDVSGHFFLQWGMNTGVIISGQRQTIQNCHIQYSAGNGISCYGRNNKILNNLIEDTAYSGVDCAGINTTGGAGAIDFEVGNNTIRRTGRSAMSARGMVNSDVNSRVARIHHNDFGDYMMQDWDGGAIYTFGQDAKFLRVDHNWFHDGPGDTCGGFYPDYAKNWIVDHNVTWNVDWGIHLEGAHTSGVVDALCFNNTIICRDPVSSMSVGVGNGVAPGSANRNNLVNCKWAGKIEFTEVKNVLIWDGKSGSATDPRFLDYKAQKGGLSFQLQANSPARDAGSAIPDYSTLQPGNPDIIVKGLNQQVKDGKPDIGAYEYGEEPWVAGCTLKAGIKPPAAPSGLNAASPSSTQLNLSWNDNSSNETAFILERKHGGGAFKQIALINANTTDYYDTGLAKSTLYSYRVRSVNSAGESANSSTISFKTLAVTKTEAAIMRTSVAPVIDGEVDEAWKSVKPFPILKINSGAITSNADLSGQWKALWDTKNLYLLVDVTDDKLQTDDKSPWYALDGVELYLDGDNSKKKSFDHINDYQIGFIWGRTKLETGGNSAPNVEGIMHKMVKTADGYRLETAIPWSLVLGRSPQPGALIGMDVHLNDCDEAPGVFKGKRAWHATGNTSWMHPDEFGTVELVGTAR